MMKPDIKGKYQYHNQAYTPSPLSPSLPFCMRDCSVSHTEGSVAQCKRSIRREKQTRVDQVEELGRNHWESSHNRKSLSLNHSNC